MTPLSTLQAERGAGGEGPLLSVRNLSVHFPVTGGLFRKTVGSVRAVHRVSLDIQPGEVVALVGESGCGKSTLGMALLGLTPPTSGELSLMGKSVDIRKPSAWKPFRRDFQIVFQDPYTSMNPRLTLFELISEPLRAHGLVKPDGLRKAAGDLLTLVGLNPDMLNRFPHAFSGGQRQRVCIARALGLSPKVLICDEVVSALDVSVQAQIVKLLMDLKASHGLSLLFITHDLSLVRSIADRVLVMYLGSIVESAPAAEFFRAPAHPYSRALLESIPTLDPQKKPKKLEGEIPSASAPPAGCAFAGRCNRVLDRCRMEEPALVTAETRSVACFNSLSP